MPDDSPSPIERNRAAESTWLQAEILNCSPDVIFARDTQGHHLYANPAFHRLFGQTPSAVIGRKLTEFVPADLAAALLASDREAIAQGRPIRAEADIVTPDGPRIYESTKTPLRDASGEIVGIIGIGRDITERRRAERLLAQAEAIAKFGSWEFDARTNVLTWSAEQFRLYDMPPDGKPLDWESFLERVHPEDRARVQHMLLSAMATGQPVAFDVRILRPDGSTRVLEFLGQAELDADGQLKRIFGVDRDITEQRQAEQVLRERSERLAAANDRLRAVDQAKTDLVNAASHDLRTPLMAILGFAELLEDGVSGPLNKTQRDDVRQIGLATQRLGRLVDDLLDFAQVQAGTFELKVVPLDLRKMIDDELALFALRIRERRFEVHVVLDAALPPVCADAQRAGRALMNLLSNAFKFTPAGGTITVAAQAVPKAVRISVRDTGPGIPKEHLTHLFKRFYQADASGLTDGVGLGLSIVAAVAAAHGGDVGVESTPGVGSTFWFTLPAATA